MRRLWKVLLSVLAALILLPLALLLFVQTGPGKSTLAGLVERLASGDNLALSVDGLTGTVPSGMRIARLGVADRQGEWLVIEDLALDWSPLALLGRHVDVELLSAASVEVLRNPSPSAEPEPEPTEPMEWPPDLSLPVRIDLERLAVDRLSYAPALSGQGVVAALDGSASLGAESEPWQAALDVRRLDEGSGELSLDARFEPQAPNRLALDAVFEEEAGGAVADLLDLPGRPPISLAVSGDGPLADWQGTGSLAAGEVANLDLRVRSTAEGDDAVSLSVTAAGSVSPELGGPAGPLLATWRSADIAAIIGFDGRVEDARATVSADALELAASGRLVEGDSALTLLFETRDHPAWRELVPGPAWDGLRLEAEATGLLEGPQGTIDIRLDGAAIAEGVGLEAADIVARLSASGPLTELDTTVDFDVTGDLAGLSLGQPQAEAMVGPSPEIAAKGTVGLDGAITLSSLSVDGAEIEAKAEAALEQWGSAGQAQLMATIRSLAPLAPGLDGRVTATASASLEDGGLRLNAEADAAGLSLGDPRADALIGPSPDLSLRAAMQDGDWTLERAALRAAHLNFTGDGVVQQQFLALGGQLVLDDLSTLSDAVEGAVMADIAATGSMADPAVSLTITGQDVVAGGRSIEQPRLAAEVASLFSGPDGRIDLDAVVEGLVLDAEAAFETAGPDWSVAGLDATFGPLALEGAVSGAGALADGTLSLSAESLAPLSDVAGIPLEGSLDGEVLLETGENGQAGSVSLDLAGLRAADASVSRLEARVDLASLVSGALSGELTARGVDAGPLAGGRADLGLGGTLQDLELDLSVSGDLAERPLEADAAVGIASGQDGLAIAARSLEANWAEIPLRLDQSATVRLPAGSIAIEGLSLSVGDASVSADGVIGDRHDLTASISNLTPDLAAPFLSGPPPLGELQANLNLTGTRQDPQGRLELSGTGLTASPVLDPLDLSLTADLTADALDAVLSLGSGERVSLDGRAQLAMTMPQGGLLPAPDMEAPLQGGIQGEFDLAYLAGLAPPAIARLGGIVELDTDLSGSLAEPQPAGTVRLRDGVVEDREIGLTLESIAGEVALDREQVVLRELTGRFPNNGELRVSASVDLTEAPAWPVDAQLTITPSRVLDGDLATVDMQSDLTLSGTLNRSARLEGSLTINRAEFRIPDTLPPSVVEVPVRERAEIAEEDAVAEPGTEEEAADPMLASIALDLDVNAPSQIFVRGRGVDVELGGNFSIGGTAADPEVEGSLGLQRGRLAALSETLTVQRAEIDFDGSALGDPNLDFLAGTQVGDVNAQIAITGTASSPEFRFVSEPPLPEEEVASLILFGEPSSEISAFQAVQLATRIAELTGVVSGPSVTDRVRDGLGLDELSVESSDTGPSLTAGRYVSDNVFVGVDQGLGAGGESSVSVEVEVTDHITIESDVGARSAGQVGINFRWDY